ncbi:MAG: MATE family efflux transporter, partial [Pseudomonadota bacterium]|nr:MATE family efflux transporter [Pseudomonadota bacterium]
HWLGTYGLGGVSEPMGVHGYWIGLIAGLSTAAILLAWRLKTISQQESPSNVTASG